MNLEGFREFLCDVSRKNEDRLKDQWRANHRRERDRVLAGKRCPACNCDTCLTGVLEATGRTCRIPVGDHIVEPQPYLPRHTTSKPAAFVFTDVEK